MRVVTFAPGGSGEPLSFLGRLTRNRWASPIFALLVLTSASAVAEILPADCARAAKYSESKRGVAMLVLQNGRTIFEHYANGGSARGRWPIFSGTKSFWGVAALAATGFELTAREWACLGELVLGQGSYHGRQIVPAAFLREAFAGSAANPSYGLTFWLNRQAPNGREADMERMIDLPWQSAEWTGVCICKDAPADMVVALGSHYQRLFIIPSLKAIIVRQGLEARFSDAHFLRLVLGRIQ